MTNAADITADDSCWTPQPSSLAVIEAEDLLVEVLLDSRGFRAALRSAQRPSGRRHLAHTHVLNAFDCTPYLQVTSATKRAGKTRRLEVMEPLVLRPWFTGRVSAAVLIRKTDAEQPTLLLDESDAAFKGDPEYAEALRGILNHGYRRSGKASLCVGRHHACKNFHTFSCKCLAGIGALPDTVADRSIRIELKRRTSSESCARWRERDGNLEAAPLRRALATWATQADAMRTR